jgi:hypothetical protein
VKTAEQGWSWVSGHPTAAALAAMAALIAVFMLYRLLRKGISAARGALKPAEDGSGSDAFIVVAALLAQAVVLNGMWGFAGRVLHFAGIERGSLFAFLDVAIIACAVRARRNMREFEHAGVEGVAVWALSALSGLFAAMAASSAGAAAFRLSAPLVAAWLWHRAMELEKQERTGRKLHLRVSLERVLVWMRLADPEERETTEVAAYARLAQLARRAKQLRALRAAGAKTGRQARALRRLEGALSAAVEHAQLATDPDRQDLLRDLIGSLTAAGSLAELSVPPPWDRAAAPARTTAELFSDIARTITPVTGTPDPGPLEPMHEDTGTAPGPWLPPADADPGPSGPAAPADGLRVPAEVDELLAGWDEPPPEDDLDAEAREVFGPAPSPGPEEAAPAPVHHEDAPRPATRTAAPGKTAQRAPSAKWTPESAGLSEDEVRELASTLSRNKLADRLSVSRTAADRIRNEYGQPLALNGSR